MPDGNSTPPEAIEQITPVEAVTPKPLNPSSSRLGYVRSRVKSIMHSQAQDTTRFGGDPANEPRKLQIHRGVNQFGLEERVAINQMTGLLNRETYFAERDRLIGTYNRDISMPEITGIRFDIDDFGLVNKQFGDQTGDQILSNVGAAVRSTVRETDIAGRVGGEEFEITAPKTVNPEREGSTENNVVAEKIRLAIEQMPKVIDRQVTVSVGYTNYIKGEKIEVYQKRLIEAQIAAKKAGKNRTMEGLVLNGENVFKDQSNGLIYRLTLDKAGKIDGIAQII